MKDDQDYLGVVDEEAADFRAPLDIYYTRSLVLFRKARVFINLKMAIIGNIVDDDSHSVCMLDKHDSKVPIA